MVQFFDLAPSPREMQQAEIGRSLGQGLAKRMGLQEAETAANNANGDPVKLAFALARASAAAPGMERSLGQIYEQLLARTNAKGVAEGLGDATGGNTSTTPNIDQPSLPTNQDPNLVQPIANATQQTQPIESQKTSPHNIDAIANQYLGEVRPDLVNPATAYGAINTFDSELKQDLSPSEEAGIRQKAMDKYKSPDVVNQIVDRVREGVKTKYNENLAKYNFDDKALNQIKEKWNTFSQGAEARLQPHLSKYDEGGFTRTKEVLKNKYNQYAAALPTNMTPEQMHTNAMALVQNDINKLDALATLPSAPPFRNQQDAKNYIDSNKQAYKDLADQGFTEALKEDAILNKDLGNEEFHSLIWGDQTSKPILNELHSFKAPKEYDQKNVGGVQINKYNPTYPQQKEKYINELSATLKKLKKTDDLVLARAMVLDSDGTIDDFNKALTQARENGLELSAFQRSQLQEINIPRTPPLYEFFSEENTNLNPFSSNYKPFLKAWAPWINEMRGKK
jgi:hypothetical protein